MLNYLMSYEAPVTAADCRMHADVCGIAASLLDHGAHKTLLLTMVQSWSALAKRIERLQALPLD